MIEEIQRDALDAEVSVDALLRRVKLAAAKLQLGALENWVEQELNGYSSDVPPYRKATGQPAAWNSYNGWIPIQGESRLMEIISEVPIGQSIASLHDLLANHSGGSLHFPVPPGLVDQLNEIMNYRSPRIIIQISRGHIVAILDTVRNMVLDWAIEMERKGVVGDGLSFDLKEKAQAKDAMSNLHIGSIGTFVGNLGTGNSSGDISVSRNSADQIIDIVDKISSSAEELGQAGVDVKFLSSALEKIVSEAKKPNPDGGRLKTLVEDARSALAGAAGNLTAEGAMTMLGYALKLFGGG